MKASKFDALVRLKKYIRITEIVDVGVREGTAELRVVFPDLHHHLIDPMNEDYLEPILALYEGISFSMVNIAVSDEEGALWLVKSALYRDGKTTHSNLRERREKVDGSFITSCERVPVRRLDGLLNEVNIQPDFLLKIDVDGIEERVIKGASEIIQHASVVVCECTYSNLHSRLSLLIAEGFSLVDLVDRVYYGESLYQVDAVLVRQDLLKSSPLRPSIADFQSALWRPVD